MTDTTKVPRLDRIIPLCKVIDLGSGGPPRLITVQLPGEDGARVLARWMGNPALAVNDYVEVRRRGADNALIVVGTDGSTADTISLATQAEVDGFTLDTKAFSPLKLANARLVTIKIKNTSGATAAVNDVGYIAYTTSGPEYKTTTTANDPAACLATCVVITGGANNADIYVQDHGRLIGKYTSTAPSVGSLLFFSTVAGSLIIGSSMRQELAAIAQVAGSGGLVEALLYSNRKPRATTSSVDIFRVDGSNTSNWIGTIAAISGANVEYTTTSGNENSMVPQSASQLGKIVLHNTTRSNSGLIDSVNNTNTGTPADGTFTLTASAPGGWTVGDVITVRSQTNTQATIGGVTAYYFDIDFSSADNVDIPLLATDIDISFSQIDAGASTAVLHPFETFSSSKISGVAPQTGDRMLVPMKLIQRRFTVGWVASGATSSTVICRLARITEAAP